MLLDLIHGDSTLVPAIAEPVRKAPSPLIAFSSAEELELHKRLAPEAVSFIVICLSSSHSLCLRRWPAYQLPAVGTLCLDNPFKAKSSINSISAV